MAQLSGSGGTQIKSENEVPYYVWSDEHDCMPLKKRLKMLLSTKRIPDFGDIESEKESQNTHLNSVDVVKMEDPCRDSQNGHVMLGSFPCTALEEWNEMLLPEQKHSGMVREYSCQGTEVNEYASSNRINVNEVVADAALVENVYVCSSTSSQFSMLSKYPVKVEVDYAGNNLMCSVDNGVEGLLGTAVEAVEIKTQIADDFMDDLDHMVLKERQKLLLSRKSLELAKPFKEGNFLVLSNSVVGDTVHLSFDTGKEKNHSGDVESFGSRNCIHGVPETNASDICRTSKSGSLNGSNLGSCKVVRCSTFSCQESKSSKSGNFAGTKERDKMCSPKKVSRVHESCGGQVFASGNPHTRLSSSLSSPFVNIKAEALDYGDVHGLVKDAVCSFPSSSIRPVKSELEIPEELYGDKVDHMILRDRIQLLASRDAPSFGNSRNFRSSKKLVPPVLDYVPTVSQSATPGISRRRKRRKTATDSVETALEEDAPGLLQVLIDKGVSVNEMKLYGETESDDVLDDSFSEDSFSELEAVISKLFSQRQSLLKLPSLRCMKVEKSSYCLACLVSLVEQARYLQFRKWPVEWGWCRDLQSFIFVFERHNRIVLERPEYGYATYFFELVDSLPTEWQLKRLVTAMKLTSCSRVTLIENRALLVGEDLTEGEARVLMEYGWIPDSGLGTMLNYCDRVVHDRRNERDSTEWSSKIGKLLMDGYNGGNIVLTDMPKKVVEFSGGQGPQIKLEL